MIVLCERVPRVARALSDRGHQRAPLTIEDEYDLQYLMSGLLALSFNDVRAEEWTPSYAGGSTKMDYLLKDQRVVLELKHTREGLSDREVGRELTEDMAHYASHPDCEHLVCFVYDPERRLRNPAGLIRDLTSRPPSGLDVRVVVAPT